MFIRLRKTAMLAVVAFCIASPARAALTTVSPTSDDGVGKDLTTIMNTLYGAGTYTRVDDSTDQLWFFTSPSATLDAQVKYAGDYSNFGAYQNPNTLAFTQLADITGSGYTANFFNPNPLYATLTGTVLKINGPLGTPAPPLNLPSPIAWGIHDTNTSTYWSSNQSVNVDPGGSGVNPTDHMVTFFVSGGLGTSMNPGFTGYVIAFEDRAWVPHSDRDFNDMVIQINGGITPSPEPSSLAIAGLGALGLIGYGIRRRRSA